MKKCQGVIVPMATPFTCEGQIDSNSVHRIIDHLIAGGSDGIFVLGTTGESASISAGEKQKLVEAAVQSTSKRAVVYAGISGNCLAESIAAAQRYMDIGADVLVAHVPYYFSLNEDEIVSYFMTLADHIAGPLMLYNMPITTHISLSTDCIDKLSRHERIVGLKDSENTPGRLEASIERFAGRDDFSFVVGCAALSAKALGMGAAGIVPSAANLEPRLYKTLFEKAVQGNALAAQELQQQTNRVSALYQGTRSLGQSLAALKAAMHLLGLCESMMLPPLVTLEKKDMVEIKNQMAGLGLKTVVQ
ncbi:MAG: dihydrodipicolinate synthase family protein [Planctomycetaceae bacterium]|nr:dihydrodipicolinate synthase family protein [Planctomycetaceae bacterium]